MKRKSFLTGLLISGLLTIAAQAQNISVPAVKNSGRYYYGSGISHNEQEARDQALIELTNQIAVNVSSDFRRKLVESSTDYEEKVESVLNTYSRATLKNVQYQVRPASSGRLEVFCYIDKNEVRQIFDARKELIREMSERAEINEEEGNIASALKLNYFSILLMNSIPDENVSFEGINYSIELPGRINRIISGIDFRTVETVNSGAEEREVTLAVSHRGKAVSQLDFTFWDGSRQVAVQARDGLATFSLYGASMQFDEVKLAVKYAYYEARSEQKAIFDLWNLVQHPVFSAEKKVRLDGNVIKRPRPDAAKNNFHVNLKFDGDMPAAPRITENTNRLLQSLSGGSPKLIEQLYGSDRFLRSKLQRYLKFNNARPLDEQVDARINKTRSGYEVRSVRMGHKYPGLKKHTTEYMVLDFDNNGELQDINMSINDNLYNRFVEEAGYGNDWGNRQEIIKFIEKYRTAYMSRDINTVGLLYAEEALIIIGREIATRNVPADLVKYQRLDGQPEYEYIRMNKSQYLERQKQIFNTQQEIFIDFGSFDIIRKNNAKGVYGVEMRQSYSSTTYSDEGYLFLLIDFNEADPVIYVRAWQPEAWDEEELIRTANFRIYK